MLILLHKNKKVYATGGEKMKKSAAYMPFSLHKQSVFVVINFSLYGGVGMYAVAAYISPPLVEEWGRRVSAVWMLPVITALLCCAGNLLSVCCLLSVSCLLSCVLQFLFAILYHPFVIAYDVSVSHTFGCPVAYM